MRTKTRFGKIKETQKREIKKYFSIESSLSFIIFLKEKFNLLLMFSFSIF